MAILKFTQHVFLFKSGAERKYKFLIVRVCFVLVMFTIFRTLCRTLVYPNISKPIAKPTSYNLFINCIHISSKTPKKEQSTKDQSGRSADKRKSRLKQTPAREKRGLKSPKTQEDESHTKRHDKSVTEKKSKTNSPVKEEDIDSVKKGDKGIRITDDIKLENSPVKDEDIVNVKRRSSKRARIISSDESGDESSSEHKSSPATENAKKQRLSEGEESIKLENEVHKEDKNDTKPDVLVKYNPNNSKYHPLKHATWKQQQPVPYSALARTFDEIEKVSSRLKMIEILSNYFRSVIALTQADLLPSVYLCLNKIAPAYEGVELGIAERL
nr:unnamed protein product [Callosobruchus chinensis]